MAGYIPTNMAGGFSYTPVSYQYGANSQVIAGGLNFNLPLSEVAQFTNAALTFASTNSQNAQGFLTGVIGQAQGNLGAAVSQSATYGSQAFNQASNIQDNAISKFFKGSGCFITTAVMSSAGKPDDCPELQALRSFRDNVLMQSETGKALVQKYYDTAPAIVAGINALSNAASIYNQLHNNYIRPALQQIAAGNPAAATDTYTAMVHVAAGLAGVDLNAPVATPTPAPVVDTMSPVAASEPAAPVVTEPVALVPEGATVTSVVESLAPIATALIPGAGPTIAIVEEAVKLEPVAEPLIMAAVHGLEDAAAGLMHLFDHKAP